MIPTCRVKVDTTPGIKLPEYKTDGAAGADIVSPITFTLSDENPVMELELEFKTAIPKRMVALLVPRGGNGFDGLALANTVGVIDMDFSGVWKAKVFKHYWADDITIEKGERFLQLVLVKYEKAKFFRGVVEKSTTRGEQGHSTGRF